MSLFFGEPEEPKPQPTEARSTEQGLPMDHDPVPLFPPDEGDDDDDGDTSKVKKNPHNRIGDPTHIDYVPPIYFGLPSNYSTSYQLREDLSGYDIHEQVGSVDVRRPSTIGFEDYYQYRRQRQARDYFREQSLTTNEEQQRDLELNIDVEELSDVFGGGTISIRPTGFATLDFSLDRNRTENPALPLRQQRITTFNFDQQIQLGVIGQIGKKMRLNVNFDTQATFDFENQLKLRHEGTEDQILQEIAAGNVSMQLGNSLIQGRQNLMGIKAKLRFGPVYLTNIASIERGQVQSITVAGGGAVETPYEKEVVEYDMNRHYFLSHYFRSLYNDALRDLPIVRSNLRINRVEVWREQQGATRNNRNIVGLVDLGENGESVGNGQGRVFNENLTQNPAERFPDNDANELLDRLLAIPGARQLNTAKSSIEGLDGLRMENTADFQVVGNMRRLEPNEYTVNNQLGYISLNTPLRPDEVLFVAFNYSLNGQSHQVGEFTDDIPADALNSNVLFTKMLKPSVLRVSPYPAWDLMMKNIYNIGYGLRRDGFFLDVKYESGTSAGKINFLPSGAIKNQPLIQAVGLDRLTNHTAPGPDNYFDYVEGITVNSQRGYIVFPVLEPFGDNLTRKLEDDVNETSKYVFDALYDLTQADAKQRFPEKNRFTLEGYYRSSASSAEIPLNTFNLAEGSVTVTVGGRQLTEGTDYTVNYMTGTLTILDPAVLASGQEITISFESSSLYNVQTKTLLGSRLEYSPRPNLALGATIMNLREQPFTQKTLLGSEPVNNTLWGLDATWSRESNFITKVVDRIPGISTKEMSNFNVAGEFAQFIPGAPRAIRNDEDRGIVYIDDFESAATPYTLRGLQRWKMASFPEGNPRLYDPTEDYDTRLASNFSRGRLAWYQIDQAFYQRGLNLEVPDEDLESNFTRQVKQSEIFPTGTFAFGTDFLSTFDLRFDPTQRGMYNYQTDRRRLAPDGSFSQPQENWAGIMREIDINNDFEATNVEFLEFWLMDPYWDDPQAEGGDFYINLGLVNEDVLTDESLSRENGLPTTNVDNPEQQIDTTAYGRIPIATPPADAFGNREEDRALQDIGLDGLNSTDEALFFEDNVLDSLRGYLTPQAFNELLADPSSDDFIHFRDDVYEDQTASILARYSRFNGTENNSPIIQGNNRFTLQGTNQPDNEDLNRNGSLNFAEQYWQYRIRLDPDSLVPGQGYVVDRILADSVRAGSGFADPVYWYQVRIPLRSGTPINGIQNFKTISFMRMYLTNFQEEVILRLAEPQLVASQWLRFTGDLSAPNVVYNPQEPPFASFELGNLSVEENSQKLPYNYMVPPGIERQQLNGNTLPGFLDDERSLTLLTCNLQDGDARGIFKNVSLDMRQYSRLKMFVHAEPIEDGPVPPNFNERGDATVFIRLGLDNDQNYYEYEIPISPSVGAANDPEAVWPDINEIDFELATMALAKFDRNDAGTGLIYRHTYRDSTMPEGHLIHIKGTPKLSDVRNIMIGVRNPQDGNEDPVCIEVWVNELRLTNFDRNTGVAANVNASFTLADLGRVDVNGRYKSAGFGPLEQTLSDRSLENQMQYGIRAQLNLDKFLPSRWGFSLPVSASYDEMRVNPVFNPQEADVRTDRLAEQLPPEEARETLRELQTFQRRRSISLLNWRKGQSQPREPGQGGRDQGNQVSYPWDLSNFDFSYSYSELEARDAITALRFQTQHQGGINYRYTFPQLEVKPFGWVDKIGPLQGKTPFLTGMAFQPWPTSVNVSVRGNRQFEERQLRSTNQFGGNVEPLFTKNFTLQRTYNLSWNLTRNLQITYNATNDGRVDEVQGYYDMATRFEQDSVGALSENLFTLGRSRTIIETQRPDGSVDTITRVHDRLVNFGRNIAYNQNLVVAYQLPFSQIKMLNWLSGNANYTGSFQWLQAPEVNPDFGGTISNQLRLQANVRADLNGLYRKVGFVQKILDEKPGGGGRDPRQGPPRRPTPQRPEINVPGGDQEAEQDSVQESKFLKIMKEVGKHTLRLVLSVKNVDVSYTQDASTMLPGYLPQTDNFGLDWNYQNPQTGQTSPLVPPTAGFVFGSQAEIRYLAAQNGWLTQDTSLSNLFMTDRRDNLTARASVEPFRGLRIDLSANRSFSENRSEFFRYDADREQFRSFDPLVNGNFTTSYIFANTAFDSSDPLESEVFRSFSETRKIISERFARENPQTIGAETIPGDFRNGYTGTNQDVLIVSLLAAYGPIDAQEIELNTQPRVPLPNWGVNFNLTQTIPGLKEIFNQFTIKHSYRGSYAVGQFQNNLNFLDMDMDGYADMPDTIRVDTQANGALQPIFNYYARNVIQAVQLTDQFTPLIGISFSTKNNITGQIDWKRGRQFTFNLGNLQLTELRSEDVSVSVGWRKDKLDLNFNFLGREFNFKNSLNAQLRMTYRDTYEINHTLSQTGLDGEAVLASQPTRGAQNLIANPSVEYAVNRRLNVRLFVEYNFNRPRTNQSFETAFTSVGFQLKFQLAQ